MTMFTAFYTAIFLLEIKSSQIFQFFYKKRRDIKTFVEIVSNSHYKRW